MIYSSPSLIKVYFAMYKWLPTQEDQDDQDDQYDQDDQDDQDY